MKTVFSFRTMVVLCAVIAFTACEKTGSSSIQIPSHGNTLAGDTTQFIDFELDGQRIYQVSSTTAGTDTQWTWYPLMGLNFSGFPDTIHYPYSSLKGGLQSRNPNYTPAFYISKNAYGLDMSPYISSKNFWTPLVKQSFVDSFFMKGSYGYAVTIARDTTFTPVNHFSTLTRALFSSGIQISWVDETGKVWQTSNGNADQAGSSFAITDNQSHSFDFQPGYSDFADYTLVTASFQCNLYDDAGNVKHVTNGRFRLGLYFQQY